MIEPLRPYQLLSDLPGSAGVPPASLQGGTLKVSTDFDGCFYQPLRARCPRSQPSTLAGILALAAPLQSDALEQIDSRLAQVGLDGNLIAEFEMLIRCRIILRPRGPARAVRIAGRGELHPVGAHHVAQFMIFVIISRRRDGVLSHEHIRNLGSVKRAEHAPARVA